MKTLPKKTYQGRAMESGDTEKKHRVNHHCNAKKMAYNREEVLWAWLLVVLPTTIF